MDCHLIAVEVCVECSTYERVNLNGLTFNQLWLERLNTKAVKRRCAVEHDWVLCDDFFENIPNHRACALDHTLCRLDVLRMIEIDKALHDEWLEEFQSHLLWQTTLVQLELRTNDDDRAT